MTCRRASTDRAALLCLQSQKYITACAPQILVMLLDQPTDDSVEIAIAFVKAVGATLEDAGRAAMHEVFVRFRAILQEGKVSKKTQYQVRFNCGLKWL